MRKLAGAIAALGAANQASKISAAPANMVIAGARSQMVSKYGIGAYIRPRMWYLSLLKLTLSQPMLIGIIALVTIMALFTYFFGWISLWYSLFYTKAVLCVIINVVLTILNAIYFVIHGVTHLILTAFLDIINGIANFFIVPIADAINQLGVFLTLVPKGEYFIGGPGSGAPFTLDPIGVGENITAQPTHGFAYYIPTTIIGPGASAFGFIAVHPGCPIYETDDSGIVYEEVYDQNGARLLFPKVDEDAKAPDGEWWTEIKPPPGKFTYNFSFLFASTETMETIWDWIANNAAKIAGELIDFINPTNIIETVTETIPPIWPIMPWLPWIW